MKTKRIQKRKVYRKKTTTKRKSINYKIRKVVKSMAESKMKNLFQINQSIVTAGVGYNTFYRQLVPALSVGAGDGQRVGNRVLVSSAVVEGYINMLPYDAVQNPFPSLKVKLWIVSYINKNASNTSDQQLTLADFATFFQSNTSGTSFQGNISDMILPVNDQCWRIHKTKIITLGLGGASTTYADSTGPHEGSGKYQSYFKFYLGKLLGNLRYDDAIGSQYPTNKNLYLLVQPVCTDGRASDGYTTAELHYNVTYKYKDM